jgi:hypothetical protein
MAQIINATPHPVHIVAGDSVVKTIPPSGVVIRLKATTVDSGVRVDGVPITKTVFGQPEGLPTYEAGTYYIVSQLVKTALPDRADLLVPAEVVRDTNGNIVGCRSLGM